MVISVIRRVHWWYQGKSIFAKALAFGSSSFHRSVSFGPLWRHICIPCDSHKRVKANAVEWFLKLFTGRVFFKNKTLQHCCCKEFPELLNCYKGNYTSGQNPFDLAEIPMLGYSQNAEACDTRADSTLFSCSPLFASHYSLFSQEVLPLRGTVLYHRSVYVLWIYN